MNIILCGLPMSGKSTIGALVAKKLEMRFVETDRMVEDAYATAFGETLTCRQICRAQGEAYFRMLEREQIAALKGVANSVIALGGGSLNELLNRQVVLRLGTLVYLKADPHTLWSRTSICGVPSYLSMENPRETFLSMAKGRMQILESTAHATVDAQLDNIDTIVNLVIGQVRHGE